MPLKRVKGVPHLYQDPASGVFYVRIMVAKRPVVRSLKTRSLDVAEARLARALVELNPERYAQALDPFKGLAPHLMDKLRRFARRRGRSLEAELTAAVECWLDVSE